MCGIAGYIAKQKQSSPKVMERMLQAMEFRGPDGQSACQIDFADWRLELGHRRLSIIDLANGKQPMAHEGHWLTFNGEIYNYLDLRKKLQQAGFSFATTSDTEILLKWLVFRGEDGLSEIDGMFAFAWWNPQNSSLLIARDRMGVKPLYYFHDSAGGLSFSSNLQSLRQDPRISKKIGSAELQTYFYLGYPGKDQGLLRDTKKLPPGFFLRWTPDGRVTLQSYWQQKRKIDDSLKESDWLDLLDATFTQAVKKSLASDVPLGLFLSGGTDSALLSYYTKKVAKTDVQALHVSFQEDSFDESRYAKAVAAHFQIPFELDTLTADEMLKNLDEALDSADEPVADHSLLPTYFLCKLAKKRGKVFLGGDGGDELFGGYASYRALGIAETMDTFLPKWVRTGLIQPAVNLLPSSDRYLSFDWKAKRFFNRWQANPKLRHLGWMGIADGNLAKLAVRSPVDILPVENYVLGLEQDLALGMGVDQFTYLPEYVLTKLDRASMKCSVEVRPPFLSNSVIDLAGRIPDELKLKGGETKYLLKKLARRVLPEELVYRPKQGFSVPLTLWTRTALKNRIDEIFRESPVWDLELDRKHWEGFWSQHQARRGSFAGMFWSLIVLDRWARKL
jgi:asparagine synthase (glutamine-hydrolysing)